MRFLRTDETIREGTPARGRPRPHSLDACPRRSFILSRGTDGTGRGLGRGTELRAAAQGKRHGLLDMNELQQVHRRARKSTRLKSSQHCATAIHSSACKKKNT